MQELIESYEVRGGADVAMIAIFRDINRRLNEMEKRVGGDHLEDFKQNREAFREVLQTIVEKSLDTVLSRLDRLETSGTPLQAALAEATAKMLPELQKTLEIMVENTVNSRFTRLKEARRKVPHSGKAPKKAVTEAAQRG